MNVIAADILKCLRLSQGMMSARAFHVTGANMDILWRQRRRLAKNITSAGPLTDGPDYSFVDGRPAPMGTRQLARLERQRALATKIVTQIGEMDFAKDRYKRVLLEREQKRQQILDSKLQPKGNLLNDTKPK